MRNPEMGGFTPKQPKEESREAIERAEQREKFIFDRVDDEIRANPATVDVKKLRRYWGEVYDKLAQDDKKKYEDYIESYRKRMMGE